MRETRTTVRDSNDADVPNYARTLRLRDALGDNGKMIMEAASSKGFELRPVSGFRVSRGIGWEAGIRNRSRRATRGAALPERLAEQPTTELKTRELADCSGRFPQLVGHCCIESSPA